MSEEFRITEPGRYVEPDDQDAIPGVEPLAPQAKAHLETFGPGEHHVVVNGIHYPFSILEVAQKHVKQVNAGGNMDRFCSYPKERLGAVQQKYEALAQLPTHEALMRSPVPTLTLRQYYAGQALAGIAANPDRINGDTRIAIDVVYLVDALIAKLAESEAKCK